MAARPDSYDPSDPPDSDRRQRVQSAALAVVILKALAGLGGRSALTALAAAIDQPAAKVHRYLASLVQEGLVAQDPGTQQYVLAGEAIQIGVAALRQCDPVRLGEAALLRLRDDLAVTAFIAVMGNRGATVLRIEEPLQPVTVNIRAGSVLPLLWSASGLAFLAFSDDPVLLQRAAEELAAATPAQRRGLKKGHPIESLCRGIRDRGCAAVEGTLLQGISAISAPVVDARGRIAAVVTALGASGGFDARPDGPIGRRLIAEARAISAAMGYREPATAS